jgi:hypothetical protein
MIKRFNVTNGSGFATGLYEDTCDDGEYVGADDVREIVEQAFMAGQADAGIDPSYCRAQAYAKDKGL